ncbi:MAG: flagellar hook assembly protein FlgD [Methylococcaceae bacterium]|nr:flagellar hook assembly protein FlgD [Methylococcaceae bacterium]
MTTVNAFSGLGMKTLETATNVAKKSLGQDEFLKLMTTQMTHQDPTKPMQNGEFLSQMAQFGTVNGIQDLQNSFKDFSGSINSNQALQAANLVGRTVSAPSKEGLLAADGVITGTFDLPAGSNNVRVRITDPTTGELIKTVDLGGHKAGPVSFVWEGDKESGNPANPGVYTVEPEALLDGKNTVLQANIDSRVESVSIGSGSSGLKVNLVGLSSVNFNQISQVF